MAAVATPAIPSPLHRSHSEDADLDTRTSSPASSDISRSDSNASRHPNPSDELAHMNAKLVTAINHSASLDDTLQATRRELEEARQRIAQLEAATKQHQELVSGGLLIKKAEVDKKQGEWQKELTEEHKLRAKAERERKKMEQELETLTSQLFEEANQMVAEARKEAEAAERRTEQYRNQLSDNEALLKSQQEQLQDLKIVLEKVTLEKDDESNARSMTEPSTPGATSYDKMSRMFESMNLTPVTPGEDIQPDHPLKFSHLIHPVLRDDQPAFREFAELVKSAWASKPPSRVSSGSFGSLNVMNLANGSTSLTTSPAIGSLPQPNGGNSPKESTIAALKDTKVYKRAVAEDIEPTMRLDIAPGVSWLARRTILNSMAAGTFSIEPMPPPNRFRGPVYPCSLCNENRKADLYTRRHRFRTTETEEAQRYPLCDPCLGRVRSTCDYISFLRMIRDGHWRVETDEDIKAAWEESVRLRERMFWQRIGGGVIPAFLKGNGADTPKSPTITSRKDEDSTADERQKDDPFRSDKKEKRVSIGNKVISKAKMDERQEETVAKQTSESEDSPAQQLRNRIRDSHDSKSIGSETRRQFRANGPTTPQTTSATRTTTPGKEIRKQLGITIPALSEDAAS